MLPPVAGFVVHTSRPEADSNRTSQGPTALNSAEAETYAAVAGLSTVLLHLSLLIFPGFDVKKIVLWTDSKAAKAIMEVITEYNKANGNENSKVALNRKRRKIR